MARNKKSSFYHARWNRCGLSVARAADVEQWDRDGCEMAERFLLLWDRKHVNLPGWDGWMFFRGVLRHGNKQWRPENILAARDQSQAIDQLRAELATSSALSSSLQTLKGFIPLVSSFSALLAPSFRAGKLIGHD